MQEGATRSDRAVEGGEVLARMMRRRGWSAPELSRRTNAKVSPSSVLAYMQGQTLPTGASAFAVASTLPREDADTLLRAWGFVDMAEAVADHVPAQEVNTDIEYRLETHSAAPTDQVPIGWRTSVEVIGRMETSAGVQWVLRTDMGSLLLASPVISFTGNAQLAEDLRGAAASMDDDG